MPKTLIQLSYLTDDHSENFLYLLNNDLFVPGEVIVAQLKYIHSNRLRKLLCNMTT